MEKETAVKSVLIAANATILLVFGLASPALQAQEKFKYEYTAPQSSKYLQEHVIDADDMPGHKLRIVEIQRTYTKNNPTIMGVKVLEQRQTAFTNYVNGAGPVIAYETWSMED